MVKGIVLHFQLQASFITTPDETDDAMQEWL